MHRLFVEKIPPFNTEAAHLIADLRANLAIDSIKSARILQRYDLDGLTDPEFAQASQLILSEPQVEQSSTELTLAPAEKAFAIEFLPGQFDQRADSAAQCVQILTGKDRPFVASARIIVLTGDLDDSQLAAIKKYLINPVDSHEVSVTAQAQPQTSPVPDDVAILTGFNAKSEADLDAYRRELGLAMSTGDLVHTQKYFQSEDREPTITELRMLDTYWSDHCRHTTFMSKISKVTFAEGTDVIKDTYQTYLDTRDQVYGPDTARPVTLMDIALMGMKELRKTGELDNVEVSNEINAASIVVKVPPVAVASSRQANQNPTKTQAPEPKTENCQLNTENSLGEAEEWLVQFKNETHNHPTEIEPFGGAATCLGGCIRDPLSGRSYVYQAMRVTGAADPRTPYDETIPGKLPQRKICQESAHGYSSYGNQIGLATGKVSEVYHPNYAAKRMEIGAVVAASPRKNVFRGGPENGDYILLIGGRTGRDGVGGATGSSKEHTDDALDNSAEVQKGDAPTERKIQRLFRNPELAPKIKICNDFGAGGVSVAIGEIADSLDLNLDAVPKKYDGLDGTELAISESQERMAICVDPSEVDYFIAESDKENLECVHVATVTDTGRLRMTWRGKTIVNLTREFLDTNGVQQDATVHVESCHDLTSPLHSHYENAQKHLSERLAPGSFEESFGEDCRAVADVLEEVHQAGQKSGIPEPKTRAERQELHRALRSIEERELRSRLAHLDYGAEKFDALWKADGSIEGAEQRVFVESDGIVLKANSGSYHGHWSQFFDRLALHQLLFPETAYTFAGLLFDDLSISFLVRQPFIETFEDNEENSIGASRELIEKHLAVELGAFRFRNDDYYLPSLDLFIEDLHSENVLLSSDGSTPLFIDPVIYRRPSDLAIPRPLPSSTFVGLANLNTASQKGLGEMFDSSVGAGTILSPFGGKHQRTPVDAMVATLPFLEGHSSVCTHMSWGFDPYIASWSPYHGAVYAVTQSVCRAVASGARLSDIRLTLQEYFPKLGGDPSRWGLPFAALLGAFKAQHELRLGAIGGKDSMSGTFNDIDVPPTLVSFALAPGSTDHVTSPEFKKPGSLISYIEIPRDENQLPDFAKLKEIADTLHTSEILAAHTLDHGGIATGLAKMAFGNGIGAVLETNLDLFQERALCFLIESKQEIPGATVIGKTQEEPAIKIGDEALSLGDLLDAWTEPLSTVYPETVDPTTTEAETFTHRGGDLRSPSQSTAQPKVIIPTFPGTNCEYDTAKVFREAGADAEIQVFRNLTPQAVEESLKALAQSIRESQILMLPGGFSAGDEPAGSGKFIATILRSPRVADAVMDLLKNRDGLILGICNGFQALVKTGLVPYGEIRDPQPGAPTLTYNDIGRHVARYATTRIASNLSPWLAGTEVDDLHNVAFSHGEGKFHASAEEIQRMAAAGQIATQYTDLEGNPTMNPEFNLNGSIQAIEGISSPCGRVLGKMGHTERRGPAVGQNISGNLRQPLFKAGVAYFTS